MDEPNAQTNHDPRPDRVRAASAADVHGANREDRRDLVRRGVKLAFVAPVITTFFAKDAYAAASVMSCYPTGQACGAGTEPCCDGPCAVGVCP